MPLQDHSPGEKARSLSRAVGPPRRQGKRGVSGRGWAGVLSALLALALACPRPATAELVSARVTADNIEFSYDRRYVTLTGNARIFGQVVEDPSRYVKMAADLIEGDLEAGRFELFGNVDVITPDGAFSGEAVRYDLGTAQYFVRRGGIMLPIENPEGERVWGYAYAREITSEDQVLILTDGRFTTCPGPDPEYTLEVDRIRYDPESWDITFWGAKLRLYGARIPLMDKFEWNFHGRVAEMNPLYWLIPTWSSRDGLRLHWGWTTRQLSLPVEDGSVRLWLTQRRGIRGELEAFEPVTDNLDARLNVSVKEDTSADIDRVVTIDRLPEIGLLGSWDGGGWGGARLQTEVILGEYTQRADEDVPGSVEVTDTRALVSVRYTANYESRRRHQGSWWWVGGAQAFYGGGEDYGWVEAGVGGAADLADWWTLWGEVSHHEIAGTSPFDFDDIDVATELTGLSSFRIDPRWTVNLGGRYDLDRNELRDYTIELRRRTDCLTWKAEYRDISDGIQVGLEVNGLFGNYDPPPSPGPEAGVPDFWERVEAEEAARRQPLSDPDTWCPPTAPAQATDTSEVGRP